MSSARENPSTPISAISVEGVPPPPQRHILDTYVPFESVGVSEVPGEPKLRTNQVDTTAIEIEDLQADEFARNFNSPLTDLNNPMIV